MAKTVAEMIEQITGKAGTLRPLWRYDNLPRELANYNGAKKLDPSLSLPLYLDGRMAEAAKSESDKKRYGTRKRDRQIQILRLKETRTVTLQEHKQLEAALNAQGITCEDAEKERRLLLLIDAANQINKEREKLNQLLIKDKELVIRQQELQTKIQITTDTLDKLAKKLVEVKGQRTHCNLAKVALDKSYAADKEKILKKYADRSPGDSERQKGLEQLNQEYEEQMDNIESKDDALAEKEAALSSEVTSNQQALNSLQATLQGVVHERHTIADVQKRVDELEQAKQAIYIHDSPDAPTATPGATFRRI